MQHHWNWGKLFWIEHMHCHWDESRVVFEDTTPVMDVSAMARFCEAAAYIFSSMLFTVWSRSTITCMV